jgi:hypothetical protein
LGLDFVEVAEEAYSERYLFGKITEMKNTLFAAERLRASARSKR